MSNYTAPRPFISEEETKRRYRAYLDNGASFHKAANALGLSSSSIQNAVGRIRGLCNRCFKNPVEGIRSKTLCPDCLEYNRQRCEKKRKRLRANNICTVCGVNPASAGTLCCKCREKDRERYRLIKDKHLPLGLCLMCESPAVEGKKYCSYHLELQKITNQRRRNINDFDGLKYKVLERDNYACQCCGFTGTDERIKGGTWLEVHHLNGRKNNMSNLITLCNKCHRAVTYMHTNPSPNAVITFLHKHYASLLRD